MSETKIARPALTLVRQHLPASIFSDKPMLTPLTTSFLNSVDNGGCVMMLSDRNECETDPTLLQVIPYVTVFRGTKAFIYSRGKGGAEERLHANRSIGLGGHVDTMPPLVEGKTNFLQHCQAEAARELLEELGIEVDPDRIFFSHLITDDSNDVGRVHLGLLGYCLLPEDAVMNMEDQVIIDGKFIEMFPPPSDQQIECLNLENWSKVAFGQATKVAESIAGVDVTPYAAMSSTGLDVYEEKLNLELRNSFPPKHTPLFLKKYPIMFEDKYTHYAEAAVLLLGLQDAVEYVSATFQPYVEGFPLNYHNLTHTACVMGRAYELWSQHSVTKDLQVLYIQIMAALFHDAGHTLVGGSEDASNIDIAISHLTKFLIRQQEQGRVNTWSVLNNNPLAISKAIRVTEYNGKEFVHEPTNMIESVMRDADLVTPFLKHENALMTILGLGMETGAWNGRDMYTYGLPKTIEFFSKVVWYATSEEDKASVVPRLTNLGVY